MTREKKMDLAMKPAADLFESAMARKGTWGKTELYKTGVPLLDEYLGGGYGRENGYEIITIFGDTGQNKSTLATQMVLRPASEGVPVAYLALEDDPEDVILRIERQMGENNPKLETVLNNIMFMPENDGYTLGTMAKTVEQMFSLWDIVVIDPLQFIFEASVEESAHTEFNRQRLFMRQMNNILKKKNKTLIIVSHTNKSGNARDRAEAGMSKIIGSTAIQQVSTKVLEISRNKEGMRHIALHKSRFTPFRRLPLQVQLDTNTMTLGTMEYSASELQQLRDGWK